MELEKLLQSFSTPQHFYRCHAVENKGLNHCAITRRVLWIFVFDNIKGGGVKKERTIQRGLDS